MITREKTNTLFFVPWKKHKNKQMLNKELEQTLNNLFTEAREQRHEFMTIEHLLFALLNNNSAASVLNACGANLNSLHDNLIKFKRIRLRKGRIHCLRIENEFCR